MTTFDASELLQSVNGPFEPSGFKFNAEGIDYLACDGQDQPDLKGWLCHKHPDNQWVTARKLDIQDLRAIWTIAWAYGEECDWILELIGEDLKPTPEMIHMRAAMQKGV